MQEGQINDSKLSYFLRVFKFYKSIFKINSNSGGMNSWLILVQWATFPLVPGLWCHNMCHIDPEPHWCASSSPCSHPRAAEHRMELPLSSKPPTVNFLCETTELTRNTWNSEIFTLISKQLRHLDLHRLRANTQKRINITPTLQFSFPLIAKTNPRATSRLSTLASPLSHT